jgi:outer membrane protein OmpA-like peptidoglycan-associated protein
MRKHLILAGLTGLLAASAAGSLPAQQKGSWELGGFGRYTDFDKSYEVSRQSANAYGVGGRLGYFFTKNFALEADGSMTWSDVVEFWTGYGSSALVYTPFHLRVMFNKRFGDDGPISWFLGAGPAYNLYGKKVAGQPGFRGDGFGSDWAVSGITGIRAHLLPWLAARVDGTIDYIWKPNNGDAQLVAQANGISATTPADKNLNLGAQAGLSLLLGVCSKDRDGTTITPTSATIRTGESASFSATATNCGRPDDVVYSVSGPGSVSASGMYTSTTAGTATVTACGRKNRICSRASVTVNTPPPPPPAVSVTSCEISPTTVSLRIDQPVTYTITRVYSDGRREAVSGFTLVSTDGAVAGASVSWSTPGEHTVSTTIPNCPQGLTARATVAQPIEITVGGTVRPGRGRDSASAFFQFDKSVVHQSVDQEKLNALAKTLAEHPEIKLVIDGHTDADGTVTYNASLGMRRAEAVKAYLQAQGAPVDRMTIVLRTFGECQPAQPNATVAGRAANRRAEIREFGNNQPGPASATCREAGRDRRP